MGFCSESEQASGRSHTRYRGENWRELIHVNEDIRGNDETILRFAARFLLEKVGKVGAGKTVVKILRRGFSDHCF